MKAIEVKQLTKRFGTFTAVDHISFEVEPGEIFGFLGANGAGKTTAKTVTSPETIKGMHGYTTIPATYGMSIPALATSNIFSFFHPSIWDISM